MFSNNNNVDVIVFQVSLCYRRVDLLMIIDVLAMSMSLCCCVMLVGNCAYFKVY